MGAALRRWINGLQDVIFPPVCVHCRSLVETPVAAGDALRHLCGTCTAQLNWVHAPHCTTCGHPFYGEMAGPRRCSHCEGLDPAFREGRTAVLFKGPARSLVIELKYHRGLHVLEDMERVFRRASNVLEMAAGASLIPVPLHPRKERERGFNQATLLAGALARAAGSVRVWPCLRRTADTGTQTALDRKSRRSNLKNAFALAHGAALNPDHHYILVDDVFTTGSTLNSCARTLRRAGALNVDVITFGHG